MLPLLEEACKLFAIPYTACNLNILKLEINY